MEPDRAAGLNASAPNAARVYDYLLGGKDNYASDRDLGDRLFALHPGARQLAEVNRRFVLAAVEWTAAGGCRQFLDLGCGLPRVPAVHDAARNADLQARVVYADRDEVVMCHVAALQAGEGLAGVRADVTDPAAVLAAGGGDRADRRAGAGVRRARRHALRDDRRRGREDSRRVHDGTGGRVVRGDLLHQLRR